MNQEENNIEELIITVRDYCSLVENYNQYEAKDFFTKISQIFSRINFTVLALPHIPVSDIKNKDLKHQTIDIKGIHKRFGEIVYHYSFNPFRKDEPVSYDVVLDIIEIYNDLKKELEKYDKGDNEFKQDALWQLQFGYVSHWGRHMAVAQSVIYHHLHDYYWGES